MWGRIAASPSKSLLATALAFVAGTAAHAFAERPLAPAGWAAGTVLAALAAGAVLRRRPSARLACAVLALAAAGFGRYEAAVRPAAEAALPPRGETAYAGTVAEEPHDSLRGTVLVMDGVSFSAGGRAVPLDSGMELRYRLPVAAPVGGRLSWKCRARRRDDAARGRSGRDAGWTCMPSLPPDVIGGEGGGLVVNALLGAKRNIRLVAGALLPEPDSSLLLGLLIGDTGGMPKDVLAAFRATGTSHVLAASGYNVHLVVECAFMLLAACAVKRRHATFAVAASLAAFTVMTGAQAPVVRAAVMGGLGLVAGLIGRRNAGAAPLAVAAAVMLAHDPLILRHDVGFRLSFAAVLGMRAFGPRLARVLAFLPETASLRKTCAETLAATAGTLPISLHDFGILPLAGPVANLAVVPLVPALSAVGAAAIAAGAVFAPIGVLLALPCAALARLMIGAVRLFAAAVPALTLRIGAWEAAALYAALGIAWYATGRTSKPPPEPPPPDDLRTVIYAP